MQLTIESVEQKTGQKGSYYKVKTNQGDFSSSEDVRPFIGKTAEFVTAKSNDGRYRYINKPLPAIPSESNGQHQGNSQEDKNKYFILSYAKDLTVALINSAQLKDASPSNVVITTMTIFNGIQDSMRATEEEGNIPPS